MSEDTSQPGWERKVIEQLAFESLRETRRKRRWGLFFRFLGFGYVGVLIFLVWNAQSGQRIVDGAAHTAVISIEGAIGPQSEVKAQDTIAALQAAFEAPGAQGVILRINSPGGSPVQAGMINDEIRRLRGQHPDKPVYAVVEDVCASGAYYVAVAADKIFVDKASLVGSIGVRMDGFGFTGTMEKIGVERRSITAGENKNFLDPFSPQNPAHVTFARAMLAEIHQQFIDVVRKGRGERLKETPELYSGLVWSGERSVEMGLSDGLGSVASVARDLTKAEKLRDYTRRENIAERFAKRLGAEIGSSLRSSVEQLDWR
ncbi:MAG: S49 family peptidase [Candidatus Dactylopiibacterium carminicum]|uniref:S49 family peptidase n=1 Tax=Candidatus Dactylopiibacterium carminicum TaxID=857335 RepID=A0A272ESQ6_9RHOO|nr:S49 family peptidase [Candidatus Dactylopiibacterium carminicum]KAF7599104.1 S49 family peptidase [Candidatus Dactylopiibacterium carminicum]PAS93135.1 MAG: S49 family peptidase [Candidatus Dactylopiibacterium carminicum]PAS96893.1 MAG: S49 family peptidase [Candidatus Dactylopiibacterium carminicum]PAS99117.1 MAG: S49 family peptidase [Candidatus Dactylopiibacterium carminicum]